MTVLHVLIVLSILFCSVSASGCIDCIRCCIFSDKIAVAQLEVSYLTFIFSNFFGCLLNPVYTVGELLGNTALYICCQSHSNIACLWRGCAQSIYASTFDRASRRGVSDDCYACTYCSLCGIPILVAFFSLSPFTC